MRIGVQFFYIGEKLYKFKKPLMFDIEKREDGVRLVNDELCLSVCGVSVCECLTSLQKELEKLWEDYVLAPEAVKTWDPCKECNIRDGVICATCEYGSTNKEQRCELATREYYGCYTDEETEGGGGQ